MKSNALNFLKTQVEFNNTIIGKNLDGITHQESMVFPNNEANCLNWIYGHLIFIRNIFIENLGGDPVWDNNDFLHYNRGVKPLEVTSHLQDLEFLKARFEESRKELSKVFENSQDLK